MMRKLAYLVGERAGLRVEADFSTEGRATAWFLDWGDGPTVDVMKGHVRAVIRSKAKPLAGLDAAEIRYGRRYSDRHLVAAWILQGSRDDLVDSRWAAESAFAKTAFPADLADDDPLWGLVDYAFAVCGGPGTYADRVIDYVASIGVRGLQVEYWLDQPAGLDPDRARERVSSLLTVSGLSDRTLDDLRRATAGVMSDLAGGGPRRSDPRVQVLAAEVALSALSGPVEDLQRQYAVQCVVDGTPLYRLSVQLGRSPSTLAKRWDTAEFNGDLTPLVWLRDHEDQWAQACADAVAEVRATPQLANVRDVVSHLFPLERAAGGDGWRRLLGSPDTARRLVTAVTSACDRLRRDRATYRALYDDDDLTIAPGPAVRWLEELLAQYAAAPPPRRRGGRLAASSSSPLDGGQ